MLAALHLGLLVLLALWAHHQARDQPLRRWLLPCLLLKLAAGAAGGALYLYYYQSGDALYIFDQAKHLARLWERSPAEFWAFPPKGRYDVLYLGVFKDLNPRLLFVAKFTALLYWATQGNFWLVGAYYSCLGYAGLWLCANTLARLDKGGAAAWGTAFLLFPSTVFWSAGLFKETLLWAMLGACLWAWLYCLHFFPSSQKKFWRKKFYALLCLGLLCLWGIWALKYYYFAALASVMAAYTVAEVARRRWALALGAQLAAFGLALAVLVLAATHSHPNLSVGHLLAAIVENYRIMAEASDVDSVVYFHQFEPKLSSFVRNLPLAFEAAFVRPYTWAQGQSLTKLAAVLENWLVMLLAVLVLASRLWQALRRRTGFSLFTSEKRTLALAAALTYVLGLALLLAFATPNLGTLMRYKVGYWPFAVALLLRALPKFKYFYQTDRQRFWLKE